MQWLTEEAFAAALELHDAAEVERGADDVRRGAAIRRSLERRQKILDQMQEQAAA